MVGRKKAVTSAERNNPMILLDSSADESSQPSFPTKMEVKQEFPDTPLIITAPQLLPTGFCSLSKVPEIVSNAAVSIRYHDKKYHEFLERLVHATQVYVHLKREEAPNEAPQEGRPYFHHGPKTFASASSSSSVVSLAEVERTIEYLEQQVMEHAEARHQIACNAAQQVQHIIITVSE